MIYVSNRLDATALVAIYFAGDVYQNGELTTIRVHQDVLVLF